MAEIRALGINCTLKYSPEPSNTQVLLDKVLGHLAEYGAVTESLRLSDYNVLLGTADDMGNGDEWPKVLERILAADILVIGMPIWFGVRSSQCQKLVERLDGTYDDADPVTGQFPLYNKVAGALVTGNEDGAHDCCSTTLFNLTHLGCTVPPNVDSYWVGTAGPGPSYVEAGGERHLYTNKTARYMAANLYYMAQLLKANPIPTNIRELYDLAAAESDPSS